MKFFILALLTGCLFGLQPTDWENSMLELSGSFSLEEMSEETVEHYRFLNEHPIDINKASLKALSSCGIFSRYQAASLKDWIERTGEIRSATELSLVNGFSEGFVNLISPFITISATSAPGSLKDRSLSADLALRADLKYFKSRFSIDYGDLISGSVSTRNSNIPESFSLSCNLRNESLCIGDFNFSAGQGLVVWTGFTTSGASSATFCRNGKGITPGKGFSRSNRIRGVAYSHEGTVFGARVAAGIDGTLASNLQFRWRNGEAGASGVYRSGRLISGVDTKFNLRGFDFYSEAAFDFVAKAPAVLSGCSYSPGYKEKYSLLARWYPANFSPVISGAMRSSSKCSDEAGVSAAATLKDFSVTADLSVHPEKKKRHLKIISSFSPEFHSGLWVLKPALRLTYRSHPDDRNGNRFDLRTDFSAIYGSWKISSRFNMVHCVSWSELGYLESEYSGVKFSINVRATLFDIQNWDDRIYVWQKDVAGTYNVPSFYGKGFSASAYLSYRKALSLRASATLYPDNPEKNGFELRLQYVKHFFHSDSPGSFDKNHRRRKRS